TAPPAAPAPSPAAPPAAPPAAAPAPPTAAPSPTKPKPGSEITVTGQRGHAPGDPLEATNLKSYQVTEKVDKAVFAPMALGYKHAVPSPVRGGLRHLLLNLDEPIVFVNYLLQFKPGKAAETLGRFTINSTIGVAGLMDVAKNKPFHLPYRHNGLANTLGYYGVKPGTFIYLPFYGATTPRDFIGDVADRFLVPLTIGFPFNTLAFGIPATTLRGLDRRAETDDQIRDLRANDPNPYVTTRQVYLRQRAEEIEALHGAKWRKRHHLADAAGEAAAVPAPAAPGAPAATVPATNAPAASTAAPAAPAAPAVISPAPPPTPATTEASPKF
ncbi:MAG: MlaA family lipoprotein, partial [Sphingomonas sp.]